MLVNPKLPDSLQDIVKSGKKIKFVANPRVDNLGDYAAVTVRSAEDELPDHHRLQGQQGRRPRGDERRSRRADDLGKLGLQICLAAAR